MREEHLAALAKLEQLCFSSPRSEATLRRELHNPTARFFTALCPDANGVEQVAGYSGMQEIVGECYVEDIAVFPEFRGQGVGRRLTQALLQTARENHCAFVTLEVRPSNEPAIHLYRSLGFAEVGLRKRFYTHPTEDALLMTCYLWDNRKG
ncbi:MAG: ribosomal protein S18-alanine N-acetyltransferase [Oscillospiraceae bacterium]|nr:ribosomal protein S18-alanine N-acetyltransferase [Oscillospiraceae bacterium]